MDVEQAVLDDVGREKAPRAELGSHGLVFSAVHLRAENVDWEARTCSSDEHVAWQAVTTKS